ncbi:hypothetical protein F2Q69_00029727 [Brassica cretica]|uniref:Uncharacterized protein n=1 Tax=Brassica cretica TaxID=69181 RepID=A0A8S9RY49_BRACR|nr:hypothetical protein F2Q69_00029727 [Brassica cretica]
MSIISGRDWLGSGSDPRKTTVRIKMRSMRSEKIKFLVVGVRPCLLRLSMWKDTETRKSIAEIESVEWDCDQKVLNTLPSGYRTVWRVVIKPVAELLEKLGEQILNYLIEPRVVTGFEVISNCPDRRLKGKRSAGMRGDISALYGSGETRERDILREGDSDRKDRESWPEGGSGSQLLAAGSVREGNISDLCSAWVLVNSSSPSYRGLDDADLPCWMAGSVEAGSAGSVHGLMVSDERRLSSLSSVPTMVMAVRRRKVAVKPGVFTGIWTGLGVINDWFWNSSKAGDQFGRGKRTEDEPAVRETGSGPFTKPHQRYYHNTLL